MYAGNFGDDSLNCGADSRNGDVLKDQLTKEQLECLEATFLRFVSNEMEENFSNWEEFYDVLNDACKSDIPRSSKNDSFTKDKDVLNDACKSDTSYSPKNGFCDGKKKPFQNGHAGIKINTERTKEQYRACGANSKSSLYNEEHSYANKCKINTSQRHGKYGCDGNQNVNIYAKYDRDNKNKTKNMPNNSPFPDNMQGTKGNNDTFQNDLKNTKRKVSKNSRNSKSKINQNKDIVSNEHISDTSSMQTLPLNNYASYIYDYQQRFMALMSYLDTFSRACMKKMKEIMLFLLCLIIIVVVGIAKFSWFVVCFLLKLVLFMVIWMTCKVISCAAAFHLKFNVFGKLQYYLSNGSDLFFLITGFNIKGIFRRKTGNKEEQEDYNDGILPSSPEEAVEYLLKQSEDKPFRTLCVTRESTNEYIKANYRKLALLVHPDKCVISQADEAFKVLDSAFKTLTDPEKRAKLMEEEKVRKEWEAFTKSYSEYTENFETMLNDMINSISCSICHGKHKRTLVKDRNFLEARYCGDCNCKHSASDGDIWAENNLFGLNWTCFICMDGEVYELTEWAECQKLRKTIPINCHRVVCRLVNQRPNNNRRGNNQRNFQNNSEKTKLPRKKRNKKGRKT